MAGSALSGPILFRPDSDGVGAGFNNLPLGIIQSFGVDGISGVDYYFNHFHKWEGPTAATVTTGLLGGWFMVTETNGWAIALGTGDRGGTLAFTGITTAGAGSLHMGQTAVLPNTWGYTVGKRMWMFTRMKVSADFAGTAQWFMGFGTAVAVPYTTVPTNGLFLRNATTAAKLDISANEGSNITTKTNAITLAATVYTVIGFYVDSAGNVHVYQDGTEITAALIAVGSTGLATLNGDATKLMQFMIAGAIETKVVTLDWLLVAQEN